MPTTSRMLEASIFIQAASIYASPEVLSFEPPIDLAQKEHRL